MASIDVGGSRGAKRSTNHEIPLIPFIDFLLCLVAFLLVTAVWSQMARINADARVPGAGETPVQLDKEKRLHVEMKGERKFQLVWKEGATVVNTIDVPRKKVTLGGNGDFKYPELADTITREWKANGSHRAANDRRFDRAVLHTDNSTPFQEVIAVIDAIYTPEREFAFGGESQILPAFNLTFAVN